MSKNSSRSSELGCLGPVVGIAGLVATLMLGPIDLGRSVYNGIIGDTPVLKTQLLDYCRKDVRRKYDEKTTEFVLSQELRYTLDNKKIDPQRVSVEKLWDAVEEHSPYGSYARWVWPSLEQD